MPQRYIGQQGIDEIHVTRIYHDDTTAKLVWEKEKLLTELREMRAQQDRVLQRL